MITFLTFIFFGIGLIIGSFLNVVIFRLNTDRTFGGRSGCLSCKTQLRWFELIPLFSYLVLRGRCRTCKVKLSTQYPLVELGTGIILAALFVKFDLLFFTDPATFMFAYAFCATILALLIVIAAYDLRHKIIPDSLSLILGALAFIGIFFFDLSNGTVLVYPHLPSLWQFLSGFFLSGPFALLWLVSGGRWMGFGDAKLALGLGWFLGPALTLSAAVLAFWGGAILGSILVIFSKKYKLKSELPFAPYLVLGTLLAFFFSLNIFQLSF